MAPTRKSTRVKTSATEPEMPARKVAKPRSRGKTAAKPELKVKKEPAKRARKKKEDVEEIETPKKKQAAAPAKLSGLEKPLLIADSVRLLKNAGASSKTVTEAEILLASDSTQLVKLINSLVNTQQDEIFEKYKQTTKLQSSHDKETIASLREDLAKKLELIETLQAQLLENGEGNDTTTFSVPSSTPRRAAKPEMYQSPIRKQSSSSSMIHQEDLANELKTIGITLDMQELLTGVRIINYEEDRDKFYFDVKQTSTNIDNDSDAVSVIYRLVIKKKFEQTAEVTYVPSFLQEEQNEDAKKVAVQLPEYFKDNLIFPYNTLLQFYAKMSKAINKAAKS